MRKIILLVVFGMLAAVAYAQLAVEETVVRAWGGNSDGQLGDGTNTPRPYPVQVGNLSGVKAIAAGGSHNLALKTDGTVRVWGGNLTGQLGNGTNNPSGTPVQVSKLEAVKAIAANDWHSLALKTDGTVWAWGRNAYGELGNGTSGGGADRNTPVQVGGNLSAVKAIAAGGNHSLALKEDGTVVAWGYNLIGQLGDGTSGGGADRNTPVQVGNLSGVKAIAAGFAHSLALKTDGTPSPLVITITWRSRPTAGSGPGVGTPLASWATGPPPTAPTRCRWAT